MSIIPKIAFVNSKWINAAEDFRFLLLFANEIISVIAIINVNVSLWLLDTKGL